MIPDKVIEAFKKVTQNGFLESQSVNRNEWKTLFDYYNNTEGNKKLSMKCIGCFNKAILFINRKIKSIGV